MAPRRIFIEKAGYLLAVPDVKLTAASLMVAVKTLLDDWVTTFQRRSPSLTLACLMAARVAAVIPPCSIHGVALTIRKFNSHRFKMKDLINVGTLTPELAAPVGGLRYSAQEHSHLWGNFKWKDDSR